MKELSDLDEKIERDNFLLWIKYATSQEVIEASKNNRKKLRYLIDKYIKAQEPFKSFIFSNYESN